MGNVPIRKIGTNFSNFDAERNGDVVDTENFTGNEFKKFFDEGVPVIVSQIQIKFADMELSDIFVTGYAKNRDDSDLDRILFQDYGSGFFVWRSPELNIGPNEYFGITTTGLENGDPKGANAEITAKIAKE